MPKTTFRNSVRVSGVSRQAMAGVPLLKFKASFNAASASQVLLGVLPAGSIPLGVQSLGGATGGTNPTVDIGTLANNQGIANEVPANAVNFTPTIGALTGVTLTADTPIYGKVGASAATGGTWTGLVNYIFDDGSTGASTGTPTPSVFANGIWNDTATWNDADIWKDAA